MWAPRSVRKVVENKKFLAPTGVRIPNPPARSMFLHRVGYHGSHYMETFLQIERFFSSNSLHHPHVPNSATLKTGGGGYLLPKRRKEHLIPDLTALRTQ